MKKGSEQEKNFYKFLIKAISTNCFAKKQQHKVNSLPYSENCYSGVDTYRVSFQIDSFKCKKQFENMEKKDVVCKVFTDVYEYLNGNTFGVEAFYELVTENIISIERNKNFYQCVSYETMDEFPVIFTCSDGYYACHCFTNKDSSYGSSRDKWIAFAIAMGGVVGCVKRI